jgi:hypothetical protein
MLIAIVQHQSFYTEPLKSDATVDKSIFPNEDRDALAGLGHQVGFIP